jgi:phospholipase C
VDGDLTSMFNSANPNDAPVSLPSTAGFLPPPFEQLSGGNVNTFIPTLNSVTVGVPAQEQGVRPARALPYELNVHATVNAPTGTIVLTFFNMGGATVVLQVRSGNPADPVRTYTVEPGNQLAGSWNVASSYNLSVYGPNGFVRYFNGRIGSGAAVLDVVSSYETQGRGFIAWQIANLASAPAGISVLDAYTGKTVTSQNLQPGKSLSDKLQLAPFYGWYDLIVTVAGDPTSNIDSPGTLKRERTALRIRPSAVLLPSRAEARRLCGLLQVALGASKADWKCEVSGDLPAGGVPAGDRGCLRKTVGIFFRPWLPTWLKFFGSVPRRRKRTSRFAVTSRRSTTTTSRFKS